jgi:peptidyl-prolyl cis-trans isomerase B (cyclophilin B)
VIVVFVGLLIFLFVTVSQVFSGEVRSKAFTQKEIKLMEDSKGIIHTELGDIILRFFPKLAPNHVNNFMELTKKGFYDGTVFHRVVPGFVIQGGDPNSMSHEKAQHGMGGPGYQVKAEFNAKPHKRGILSMARSAHPDSAGSQFFICVSDAPFLDGKYTVFGEVTHGMDVVDNIVSQPRDAKDNPIERIEIKVEIIGPKDGQFPSKNG